MSTIPLNDALKAQKFNTVSLNTAIVDELTTAPGTIFLGSVTLENNFPKYMTIGDPDGGNLSKGANGKLFATTQLFRDSSILVGDAQTELFNTYDGNKNLFAAPAFYNTNVVLSTIATTPCTRTTTTIDQMVLYVDAR